MAEMEDVPYSKLCGRTFIATQVHTCWMRELVKEVDEQGRIVLPAAWRKRHLRGRRVLLRARNEVLEILPQEDVDLTAYFDAARKADIKADLADWRTVRRELRKR